MQKAVIAITQFIFTGTDTHTKQSFTLSFWTTRKKVCKACPERSRGKRIADTALLANSSSIPIVLTLILYLNLPSLL